MSEAEDQTFAAAAAAVDAAVGEASAATVCEPAEKKSKPSKEQFSSSVPLPRLYQDHQIAGPLSKARCEGQAMQGW